MLWQLKMLSFRWIKRFYNDIAQVTRNSLQNTISREESIRQQILEMLGFWVLEFVEILTNIESSTRILNWCLIKIFSKITPNSKIKALILTKEKWFKYVVPHFRFKNDRLSADEDTRSSISLKFSSVNLRASSMVW